MIARSYLYVPADQPDKLAKARDRGADALVLDLEDAVASQRKGTARDAAGAFLAEPPSGPELWVRVNSDQLAEDIRAVASPAVRGLWVPKAEPDLLGEVDLLLGDAEREIGLPPGSIKVVALIETARGVLAAPAVAASERVFRLGLGEADLCGELGLQPGAARVELAPIRSQVVVASAAARIAPPVGPVETAVRDLDRLRDSTLALLRQGFRARSAIHPGQLATINGVFTPSAQELAAARAVLEWLAAAERRGSGVAVDDQGRMIDRAVVRLAQEVVERAAAG
jgi:citrate lyase subunit beta/citryl-CoA lyase